MTIFRKVINFLWNVFSSFFRYILKNSLIFELLLLFVFPFTHKLEILYLLIFIRSSRSLITSIPTLICRVDSIFSDRIDSFLLSVLTVVSCNFLVYIINYFCIVPTYYIIHVSSILSIVFLFLHLNKEFIIYKDNRSEKLIRWWFTYFPMYIMLYLCNNFVLPELSNIFLSDKYIYLGFFSELVLFYVALEVLCYQADDVNESDVTCWFINILLLFSYSLILYHYGVNIILSFIILLVLYVVHWLMFEPFYYKLIMPNLVLVVVTFSILFISYYEILSNFSMIVFMNCSITIVLLLLLAYTINISFFATKYPRFITIFSSFLKYVSFFIGLTVVFSLIVFLYSINPFVFRIVFFVIIILCTYLRDLF